MVTKYYKSLVISLFIAAFLFKSAVISCVIQVSQAPAVRWEALNLTEAQRIQIIALDTEWQKTSAKLMSKIICDKKQLKTLLTNPFISDTVIKNLQNRILANQKKLRYYAMENFLQKRKVLTFWQRQKLHGMLSI